MLRRRFALVLFALAVNLVVPVAAQEAPAISAKVARISGGVIAGNILTKVQPVYPPEAKEAHVSGAVVMHARIDSTGNVAELEVISGPEMLRASALEAVKQWTYKPYVLNGKPVDVDTTITVNFAFGD